MQTAVAHMFKSAKFYMDKSNNAISQQLGESNMREKKKRGKKSMTQKWKLK